MTQLILYFRSTRESMMRSSACISLLLIFSLFTTSVLSAEGDAAAFFSRYPAGSIQSVEQAITALGDVNTERDHVSENFLAAKDICLHKFFVSSCLDKAKDRKRKILKAIREVEVEANAYLRKEKADERDRNVAERMRKAESAESFANKIVVPMPDAPRAPRSAQPEKADTKP
jgi:hypothetical protein